MSRCAMTLPIVARRSPAMRTPPVCVDGDDRRAVRRVDDAGRQLAAGRQQVGRDAEEVANEELPGR